MAYSNKVLDHYENPRNVGSLPKADPDVGTGVVGAPVCGDVMKLQIRVTASEISCPDCSGVGKKVVNRDATDAQVELDPACAQIVTDPCPRCGGSGQIKEEVISDAKFKTFGCGSAIASSSLATEWMKGKTLEQAQHIKNTDIVEELALPPVKIHCSVLAEDAIKAAVADFRRKQKESANLQPSLPKDPKLPEDPK